jgi:hypothetical protein
VWRLDETAWTRVLKVSDAAAVTADCRAAGDVTHVLLYAGVSSRLATIEHVPGSPGGYTLWKERPDLVDIPLSDGVETATIDLDSTGRLWLASDARATMEVRCADPPYDDWSGPITIARWVTADDICAVTALPDRTIGVLWSNQWTRRFGFRTHRDGTDPAEWSPDEAPASRSALNVRDGMADDHLNVAVSADGMLYAAVKTSYDTAGYPKVALLVRRPSGTWDYLHPVDEEGTRPIVLLNESRGFVRVIYTAGRAGIVYRESPIDSIAFGPRQVLLPGALNNATSTKQTITDELVVLASDGRQAAGFRACFHSGASSGLPRSRG